MTNDDTVNSKLKLLKETIPEFKKLWLATMRADKGKLFPMDLYTTTVTHRALCLNSGFCLMIKNRNFICAAPLVRLQLDNLIRLYAAWIVDDPHRFVTKILSGEHIRNITDRNGKKMLDSYLVEQISNEYPWAKKLYKETSGYVHLSRKHYFNTVNRVIEEERLVECGIGTTDINIPEGIREEAIDAMTQISKTLLRYLHGWGYTKNEKVGRVTPAE